MLQIRNLSLPLGGDLDQLRVRAARALGVRPGALGELEIVRQSIDARDKRNVHYVYTVETSMPREEALIKSAPGRGIALMERVPYAFPPVKRGGRGDLRRRQADHRPPRPPDFRRAGVSGGGGRARQREIFPQAPYRHRRAPGGGQDHPAGAHRPGL